MPIPVTVTGVSGRMGQMLVKAVQENPETELVGATDRPGSDWIGRDSRFDIATRQGDKGVWIEVGAKVYLRIGVRFFDFKQTVI